MRKEKIQQIVGLVNELFEEEEPEEWQEEKDWIKYSGPYFDQNEFKAAIECLLDRWLVVGEKTQAFEKKFPKYLGCTRGVLTNSGSSANLLMVSALKSKRWLNLPEGSKIITPVSGFPTTINPIIQNNFKPVFIDIEIDTLNLNLDQLEQKAKEGAKALIFAHALGNPPNMDRVMEIVEKYNLILIEDCCDALGSTYDGKPLGSFGVMASCSFYPAHHMTMGEGGFVACKEKQIETVVRSFRDWGRGCYCIGRKANLLKNGFCGKRFSCWLPKLPKQIYDHKYTYEEIGYNLKPIDLQAAIGLEQIKKLNLIDAKRKATYNKLYKIFEPYEEFFVLPKPTPKSDPSWFAFPLTIRNPNIFTRNRLTDHYESYKIQTRNYFAGNVLLHPAYDHLSSYEDTINKFPVATKVTTDTFFLGTSPVITDDQIAYIKKVTDLFMSNFGV